MPSETTASVPANFLEQLADMVAERVAAKLETRQELISREQLSAITGIGLRTIDRMCAGGSWEKDRHGRKIWRESAVKLEPIRNGRSVRFDRSKALAAIRAAG